MELHILFFILAGILIAVLVGYSIWSARREKSRVFSNTFSTRPPAQPIKQTPISNVPPSLNINNDYPQQTDLASVEEETSDAIQQEVQKEVGAIKINIPGQEPVADTLQSPSYEPQSPVAQPQPARQVSSTPRTQTIEELAAQRQAEELRTQTQPEIQPEQTPAEPRVAENGIATLYIVAPENQEFLGTYVVKHLEALGFLFGEYNIFHRHQHSDNPSSRVLFSVANMMQPGVFDLAKIDRFQTVGLVMFMHLPAKITDMKMMITLAEGLAQSLGGFVLNERQELFDEASRQAYLKCVR